MAFLLRKQWTLYSVSPLYKFSSADLKDYARMLGVFIAAEKQKGLAVDVDGELGVKVAMSGLPELRGSEQDPAAVLVQVGALGWAVHSSGPAKVRARAQGVLCHRLRGL